MKGFNFEFKDGKIHILEYPSADVVLSLPDDYDTKRLKDMLLHWFDLQTAQNNLKAIRPDYPDIVNSALAQNAIILFFKCFGKSEFRNNSLRVSKILAAYPPEAKKVFDYYKTLRDKHIAHDESRYSQVISGVILESQRSYPFVDVVNTIAIADVFQGENNQKGLQSFYNLTFISIEWVEHTIDELSDIIRNKYHNFSLADFKDFYPLKLDIPSAETMFQKRY
jgi:glutaredoxin-related protein